MVLALALTFYVAYQQKLYVEEQQIVSPDISLGPIIAYFFGVVVLVGLVLFLIPTP